MNDCTFCKIINGEIPSHKVFEDDKTVVFLDIFPIQPGHALVVSKTHEPHLESLPQEDYLSLIKVLRKVSIKQKEVTGAKRICVRVEGFDISHAHIHAYPCNSPNEFYGAKDRQENEPNHDNLKKMAEKLKFE